MEELLKYYSNLLIVQYNGKHKATKTINLLTYLIFVNLVLLQIQNAFDWKTAVGSQLDIIGKWVGVSREYNGLLFWGDTYMSYPNTYELVPSLLTDNQQHGYSDYSTFDSFSTGNVLTYDKLGFVDQSLSDDNYRIVIGLKILKNNINHTAKNIDDAIWDYFNGNVYTTWDIQHQVIYHYPSELNEIMEICSYKNVLPAPTGVQAIIREIT